jgi:hypothetical protein
VSKLKYFVLRNDTDREEVTKEGDFAFNDDEDDDDGDDQEDWDGDGTWANDGDDGEGDIKDESAAYLEFLNEEVGFDIDSDYNLWLKQVKAQKFGTGNNDDDDTLEEESLLETPLDRVEPYGLFKGTLLSKWSNPLDF